jgi:hypothetical protein
VAVVVVSTVLLAASYTRHSFHPYAIGDHYRRTLTLAEGRIALFWRGKSQKWFDEKTSVQFPGAFAGRRHPPLSSDALDTESGVELHLAWLLGLAGAALVGSLVYSRRRSVGAG